MPANPARVTATCAAVPRASLGCMAAIKRELRREINLNRAEHPAEDLIGREETRNSNTAAPKLQDLASVRFLIHQLSVSSFALRGRLTPSFVNDKGSEEA